jgi:hypothetical protein
MSSSGWSCGGCDELDVGGLRVGGLRESAAGPLHYFTSQDIAIAVSKVNHLPCITHARS